MYILCISTLSNFNEFLNIILNILDISYLDIWIFGHLWIFPCATLSIRFVHATKLISISSRNI